VNNDPRRTYTITSSTALSSGTAYALSFHTSSTFQIQPTDLIYVTMYPSQFYNYVTLTCNNSDTSLNTWTNFEYTIDLLT